MGKIEYYMEKTASGKFQFAIDRGGTFTDVFARCPNGKIVVQKLLSEYPTHYKDAPTEGIRRILQQVKLVELKYKMPIQPSNKPNQAQMKAIRKITNASSIYTSEQSILKKLEYIQMKRQIEVLATFVPNEILSYSHDELQRNFVGVLLFADVSGFTPLTEKYNKTGKGGIYRLTATLNAYIGAIVEVIHFFGGDILKFSGDAFLALWKVKQGTSAYDILHGVVVCALIIQKNLGVFETEVNVMLKVKLAISCGNITFSVIGTGGTKYYVVVGDAIYDAKNAEHVSVSGDVVISPAAWSHMLHDRYDFTPAAEGNIKVLRTIYQKNEESKRIYYEERTTEVLELVAKHLNHRSNIHSKQTFESNYTMSKITDIFIKSLPKRDEIILAPKHWIMDEIRPFIIKPVQDQVDESQPVEYLTEMREITIQFINIVPVSMEPEDMVEMCHNSYKIICRVIGEALGVVNKVSLFDKDFMILVLFGLRGIRHEMESQHALRSAFSILNMVVQCVTNVSSCSIGLTQGLVYCGVVGHPFRREYTVIGTEVNKAARMMCAYPSKVICDYKTFKHSKLASFYFQLQSIVKLKGIEDAGSIYEYNEDFDDFEGKNMQKFIVYGRIHEYNMIKSVVYKDDKTELCDFNGICFWGPRKIGRTSILLQSIRALRLITRTHTVLSIELNSKSLIPYFCVNKLYEKMFDNLGTLGNLNNTGLAHLPRHLFNLNTELFWPKEDVALFKYNILKTFRDIIDINYDYGTIIFIDNLEFIDLQSWEILEIIFHEHSFKFFASACFENEPEEDFVQQIESLKTMMLVEVLPIPPKWVSTLACMFLDAVGIPDHLEFLLTHSCEGRPGYIQSSILRLINNGSLQLKLINKSEMDPIRFIFPEKLITESDASDIIAIVEFSERYKHIGQELTLQAISMDLFDSFTPYQQLIIKTASVLGEMFDRSILVVAMKYPPDEQLALVMKQLFEEEVFECGSKFIYATDMDTPKFCCTCYNNQEAVDQMTLPKYAYCKIIHFKNKCIRDVAYDLLPGNQKKELHLLCTEVIEYAKHACPTCTRQPITNILHLCLYKTVMEFCANPKKEYSRWMLTYGEYGNMKAVIKNAIHGIPFPEEPYDISVRPHYDPNRCNCSDIWVRVLKDLRYHSEQGKHTGKLVYFTMKYGFVLLLIKDYKNAIRYMREAIELCLIDVNQTKKDSVLDRFNKFIMGRTEIGLCQAHLALGQIQTAKNHLVVALRQYNIPSLALEYHVFNEFIKRSFLVNIKQMYKVAHDNSIARFDCGNALAYSAKIFALEGKWALAKFAALNSLQIMKGVNCNISLLMEIYCNIIELYSFADTDDSLQKLQKYVFHEVTHNFVSPDVHDMSGLITLMETLLESLFVTGEITNGVRLGYRMLDICTRLDFFVYECRLFYHLPFLLILNGRIRDAGEVLNILKNRMHSMDKTCSCYYYIVSFQVYIATGFIVEEIDSIINFARDLKSSMVRPKRLYELLFTLVQLHYLRLGKYSRAEEWKTDVTWNIHLIKYDVPMKALLFLIECRILNYINSYQKKSANISVENKRITKLLAMFREACKSQYTIYYPFFLYYKAWLLRLADHKRQAQKLLNQIESKYTKNGNVLMGCYTAGATNAWGGGYTIKYDKRPNVKYTHADTYSIKELKQFVPVFPLE